MKSLIIYINNNYNKSKSKIKLNSKGIEEMRLVESCALNSFAFFYIIPIYILYLELIE